MFGLKRRIRIIMKKLLSLLPLLLLTSCEESLTVGVHYKNGDNIVHYACPICGYEGELL